MFVRFVVDPFFDDFGPTGLPREEVYGAPPFFDIANATVLLPTMGAALGAAAFCGGLVVLALIRRARRWIDNRLRQQRRNRFTETRRAEVEHLDHELVDEAAWRYWNDRDLHLVVEPDALNWIDPVDLYTNSIRSNFSASVRLANPDSEQDFDELPQTVLGTMATILAQHTTTPTDARMCVWDGYAYPWGAHPSGLAISKMNDEDPAPWPWPILPSSIRNADKATLAGYQREFVVFTGPVAATARVGWFVTDEWYEPKWPDVIYPADRAWLTYSDADEDTIDVHGSTDLIDALGTIDGVQARPGRERLP